MKNYMIKANDLKYEMEIKSLYDNLQVVEYTALNNSIIFSIIDDNLINENQLFNNEHVSFIGDNNDLDTCRCANAEYILNYGNVFYDYPQLICTKCRKLFPIYSINTDKVFLRDYSENYNSIYKLYLNGEYEEFAIVELIDMNSKLNQTAKMLVNKLSQIINRKIYLHVYLKNSEATNFLKIGSKIRLCNNDFILFNDYIVFSELL